MDLPDEKGDNNKEYIKIPLEESIKLGPNIRHVAHCFIFTGSHEQADSMFGLMQMRTDGKIGFPGGEVDEVCPTV